MSDRERNYMELLAHLEKVRLAIGAVNPRFPYYERMIRQGGRFLSPPQSYLRMAFSRVKSERT
jgi:hypothetical protein